MVRTQLVVTGSISSADSRVKELRLGFVGGGAHRLDVLHGLVIDRDEVDALEGIEEDGRGLGEGITSGTAGDLEALVAAGKVVVSGLLVS